MKKYLFILLAALLVLQVGICATAKNFDITITEDSFDVVVNSKSGPWNPMVNKSKDYSFKSKRRFRSAFSQDSPTILRVKPGDNITIQYMNGYVYADRQGFPERKTDADGYPQTMNTYAGSLPSSYINEQINHMALIGTFADSKGVIVGCPFLIGDGPVSLVVPDGAERLQMGVNDNLFKDNAGLFIVKVNVNQ